MAKGGLTLLKVVQKLFNAGRTAYIWNENLAANKTIAEGVTSGKLEEARMGTLQDLGRLGMVGGEMGFLLGICEGQEVRLPQDYHIAVAGPAGMGKTSCFTMPNILRAVQGGESQLIFDFKKGELVQATAAGLEVLTGEKPLVFAPYSADNAVKINPFQSLIDAVKQGEPVVDESRARIQVFFAEAMKKAGQNEWIPKSARIITEAVAVARAYLDPEALTPGSMYDFATAGFDQVADFFAVASEHEDIAGGYVAAAAHSFLNTYKEDDQREFRWVMQAMAEAFQLFAPGSRLRAATENTTVDIASFRTKPQVLFVEIPDRHLLAAGPFLGAVLDYAVETAAYADGPHRLSIIAEEFAALPFNENVVKWARTYRSLGIRLVTVVQDRSGYSKFKSMGGHKPFLENSVTLTFGITDPQHLRDLEARAGKRSVLVETNSTSLGISVPGRMYGGVEQLTPVLPASEIARIGLGKALMEIPGEPLFILDRKPWWEMPELAPYIRDTRFDS